MRTLRSFFKWICQPWFISLIIVGSLTCLIAFYGQLLFISSYKPLGSPVYKGMAIGILWFIFALCHLRLKPITRQPKIVDSTAPPPVLPRTLQEHFTKNFMRVIRELKQTTGDSLPVFIMLGAHNTGKKSLLACAGLTLESNQPIEPELAKTYLDIHLGEKAIFLTASHQYASEHAEVDSNWHWLTKQIHLILKKGVRGIILTYSLTDMLQHASTQLHQQMQVWRARIKTLEEQLGYALPIYLVMTQCDRLAGFNAFFGNLTPMERQQAWGMSLKSINEFDQQYGIFLQRLHQRIFPRLQQTTDEMQRVDIMDFPLQMAAIQKTLAQLVQAFVKPNKYAINQEIAGLYFVSSLQEGESIDGLMGELSKNLEVERLPSPNKIVRSHHYFIQQLFNEIIIPNSAHTIPTSRTIQRQRRWVWTSYTGLAASTVVLSTLWYTSYQNNTDQLQNLMHGVSSYQKTAQMHNERATLTQLNQLMKLKEDLNAYGQSDWLSNVGFDQANTAITQFSAFYHTQLQRILMPGLIATLDKELQENLKNPTSIYSILKAYLMFAYPDHMQASYVQNWFTQFFQSESNTNDADKVLLEKSIAALLSKPLPAQTLNPPLIEQARQAFGSLIPAQDAYAELQRQSLAVQQEALALNGNAVTGFEQIFNQPEALISIPGLYTITGYQQAYLKLEKKIAEENSTDNWVSGKTGSSPESLDTFRQEMQSLYFADYVANWNTALNQLHVRQFANLKQTTDAVKLLAGPFSPMQKILMLVKKNTQRPVTDKVLTKPLSTTDDAQSFNQAVSPYFSGVSLFLSAGSQPFLSLQHLQQQLQSLYIYLNDLSNAPNIPQASYLAAKALVNYDAKNPLVAIQQQLEQYPAPVRNWMGELIQQSAKQIFSGAQRYVNDQWLQIVYTPYSQSIQSHYPFNGDMQVEVTPADFADFLGPQGILAKFNTDYLQGFIDTSQKNWQLRSFAGQNVGITERNLSALQYADRLSHVFFTPDGKLGIRFDITATDMSPFIGEAQLLMDKDPLSYRHDPQLPRSFNWPINGNARISLQLIDLDGTRHGLEFSVFWALFKWLNTCQIQSQSATQYGATCRVEGRWVRYNLQADSANNPFDQLSTLSNWSLLQKLS